MQTDNRPLSPHVQIYKQGWTGGPSILHRITGVALSVGSLLLIYWLIALAGGPESYARANGLFGSALGKLILFGFTWALMYKSLAGIRHLYMDTGAGFEVPKAKATAQMAVFGSIVLTILIWIVAFI